MISDRKSKKMIGIYFSGTGNSRYCIEKFLEEYDNTASAYSIEDDQLLQQLDIHNEIVFSYPVQYSNIPKILRDYIVKYRDKWQGKKIFVIATMAMFSGDGAGVLGRLLEEYGAIIIGGLHLKMPDSICDEKVLKNSLEKNRMIIRKAEDKISKTVITLKQGKSVKEGLGVISRLVGCFGQRIYFVGKMNKYYDKLKINSEQCIGCGACVKQCPMNNIELQSGKAISSNRCTMCYRCANICPKQAIMLLGKKVVKQGVL